MAWERDYVKVYTPSLIPRPIPVNGMGIRPMYIHYSPEVGTQVSLATYLLFIFTHSVVEIVHISDHNNTMFCLPCSKYTHTAGHAQQSQMYQCYVSYK